MALSRHPDTGRNPRIPTAKKKEETKMDAMVEALKPFIIFAMVLWGIETVVTMLIKDHKQAKRKRARCVPVAIMLARGTGQR